MPAVHTTMGDSDWDTVTVLRKRPTNAAAAKSGKAISSARRTGAEIETSKKFGGGGNRQHNTAKNTMKLDEETEELSHQKVPLSVGKAIMQGRQAKGWTQKELGTKINEKPQVIAEYENGKSIPNQQILGKIQRQLGVKLSGKNIGDPLQARGKKDSGASTGGKKKKGGK